MRIKRLSIVIIISLLAMGLLACASSSDNGLSADAVNDTFDLQANDIEIVKAPNANHKVELPETEKGTIDYTFIQALSSTMKPFAFRILGEKYGWDPYSKMLNVSIDSFQISDVSGELIQEIDDLYASPLNATKQNRYGLVFYDYNFDGYLDISIRKSRGASSDNRTDYYWLWDNDKQQFVYDWELSEAITDENRIDFTVSQSINDEMAPLSFHLLGRWIRGWSSDIQAMADGQDLSIQVLQVMDSEGNVIQEFDRLNTTLPRSTSSFGLEFADYNFDGYLDIALYLWRGGSMGNDPHQYWLWDSSSQQFVANEELTNFSHWSRVSVNTEESYIELHARGLNQQYRYLDGSYTLIYSRVWGDEQDPDRGEGFFHHEIIKELIDGEFVTTETYSKL